jgi:hypothetical protein
MITAEVINSLSIMKVTTQRTNKPAKLLMLLGVVGLLVGLYGLITQQNWSLLVFALAAFLWIVGKLLAWWLNE